MAANSAAAGRLLGDLASKLNMSLDDLVAGVAVLAGGSTSADPQQAAQQIEAQMAGGAFGKAPGSTSSARSSPYGGGGKGASADGANTRVFVGNLAYSTSWQDLKDHMKQVGTVSFCDIIAQPGTAMGSKGCGLVEYSSPFEAQRAIKELSETILRDRPIFVREDRELGISIATASHRGEKGGGAGGGGKGGATAMGPSPKGGMSGGGGGGYQVFVGNLPYSATWRDLKDHMRTAGDVLQADIISQPGTAMGSKGCGLVRYATAQAAQKAITMLQDSMIKGRPIFIREDREAGLGGGGGGGGGGVNLAGSPKGGAGLGGGCGGGGAGGGSPRGTGNRDARVFVGNLSYSVSWQELKDHMRAAGTVVSSDIIAEPGTAMGSKGCGVVEYSTPAEAQQAILMMHESPLKGRNILCRIENF